MSEPLALAVALLAMSGGGVSAFVISTARAQAEADVELVVRAGANGSTRCFEVEALRQRISHYSATGLGGASGLRLELYVDAADSAELSVVRDSEVVARRRFDNLPAACVDRRDAVALSIALALDGVIQDWRLPRSKLGPRRAIPPRLPMQRKAGARRCATRSNPSNRRASRVGRSKQERRRCAPARARAQNGCTRKTGACRTSTREQNGSAGRLRTRCRGCAQTCRPWAVPRPARGGPLARRGAAFTGVDRRARRRALVQPAVRHRRLRNREHDRGLHVRWRARESRLTGGELLGCSVLRFGNFAAQGCVGAVAAACEASGESYPVRFPAATVLWAASTARLALRWPDARRVSVRLVAQGHVNMVRPELRVDGSSEQLAPAWLGASVGLDMLVSLE